MASSSSDLPAFTAGGVLPPGDYVLTLEELRGSLLVTGSGESPHWDRDWRCHLVNTLEVLVRQLHQVGITEIFINGSFVEDKDHPNDIDGYFECAVQRVVSGDLQRELNQLDPHQVWTWDPATRRPYRNYPKRQLPMWHAYRIELYPHFDQLCGIRDHYGNELKFPAAFRRSRLGGTPKGIVKIGVKP